MSLYVASLLPPLYRSQRASSWQRLWREIKVYHPVVSALIEEREGRAQLQALHILTLATSSFFILALLASLQVPTIDDGHALCTKHHNDYDSCLAERTIFDSATGLCEWDAYYAECNYPEGGPTMTRFAYASILVIFSVAVVPVHLMIDYLCTRYILAPTAADIDKDDDEVFVQTATRASSVIRTAELDKRKREARFIASMEKGDEDEGDSSIHGYHSDIDKKNLKEALAILCIRRRVSCTYLGREWPQSRPHEACPFWGRKPTDALQPIMCTCISGISIPQRHPRSNWTRI